MWVLRGLTAQILCSKQQSYFYPLPVEYHCNEVIYSSLNKKSLSEKTSRRGKTIRDSLSVNMTFCLTLAYQASSQIGHKLQISGLSMKSVSNPDLYYIIPFQQQVSSHKQCLTTTTRGQLFLFPPHSCSQREHCSSITLIEAKNQLAPRYSINVSTRKSQEI